MLTICIHIRHSFLQTKSNCHAHLHVFAHHCFKDWRRPVKCHPASWSFADCLFCPLRLLFWFCCVVVLCCFCCFSWCVCVCLHGCVCVRVFPVVAYWTFPTPVEGQCPLGHGAELPGRCGVSVLRAFDGLPSVGRGG